MNKMTSRILINCPECRGHASTIQVAGYQLTGCMDCGIMAARAETAELSEGNWNRMCRDIRVGRLHKRTSKSLKKLSGHLRTALELLGGLESCPEEPGNDD